jgi:hypothetical protein
MKYRFKVEVLDNGSEARATRAYIGDVSVMDRSLARAAAVVLGKLREEDITVQLCTRSAASVAEIEQLISSGIDRDLNSVAFTLNAKSDKNYECIVSLIDWTLWYCLQRPYVASPDDISRIEITESSHDDINCILDAAAAVC